jgi:hypothetical protein
VPPPHQNPARATKTGQLQSPNVLTDGTLVYVYGQGSAYTVDRSNNVPVMHTDGLGSVRA